MTRKQRHERSPQARSGLLDTLAMRDDLAAMAKVSLDPTRHRAANVAEHSFAVARRIVDLARGCGADAATRERLRLLGLLHDLGKIEDNQPSGARERQRRPEAEAQRRTRESAPEAPSSPSPRTNGARERHPKRSVMRLRERHGVDDEQLLALVRYHDIELSFYLSAQRGEAPTDRAWARLARKVDLWELTLMMLADRVDCPGGYRNNPAVVWFLEQLEERKLLSRPIPRGLADALEADAGTAACPGASYPVAADDEDLPVLGLDIGRVIIGGVPESEPERAPASERQRRPQAGAPRRDRESAPKAPRSRVPESKTDTAFLGGDEEAAMDTPPMPGALATIAALVEAYQGRVHLVSKCGPRVAARTRRWLAAWHVFELTGLPPGQLHFCRQRADKAPICARLGVQAFVDDRGDVLRHLRGIVPWRYRFGGAGRRGLPDAEVIAVADWPAVAAELLP